jgi:putative sigma-54 modulation protein
MTITIRSQNFKMGDNLEGYAKSKLERLNRYLPRIGDIYLDLARQRTGRGEVVTSAQITLRHERGAILRSEERLNGEDHETIEAVINKAVDKMYRQIERFKGKRRNHKGKSRFSATIEELDIAEDIPEDEYTLEEEITADTLPGFVEPAIARRKQVQLQPMSEADAIEQMELLGHTFFMFLDEGTQKVSVVYRRGVGDYGMLVPDTNGEMSSKMP